MSDSSGPGPRRFAHGGWLMGRIPRGADLAGFLDGLVREQGITSGALGIIGVVERARLGFFDTVAARYEVTEVPEHRELASCLGNVSLRDGHPAVHLHAVLSDVAGGTVGGHVMEGTVVHYAEFWLAALDGQAFQRGHDPGTNVLGWVR